MMMMMMMMMMKRGGMNEWMENSHPSPSGWGWLLCGPASAAVCVLL